MILAIKIALAERAFRDIRGCAVIRADRKVYHTINEMIGPFEYGKVIIATARMPVIFGFGYEFYKPAP